MVNLRFILVVVVITLGSNSFGCSQGPGPESAPPANENNGQTLAEESGQAKRNVQWWRDESIAAEFELTDDQVQAIDELMTVNAGNANQHLQQERQLTLRYLRALNQEPYDTVMVDRVSERLIEVMSSEHRRRIERVRTVRDILTQEQWTKLWEVAPRALQMGRFRALRGPKVSVSEASLTPTP